MTTNQAGSVKFCRLCQQEQPIEVFPKKKLGGYYAYCRPCDIKRRSDLYHGNREESLRKIRLFRRENKKRISDIQKRAYIKMKGDPDRLAEFRKKTNDYVKKRTKSDLLFKLVRSARNRLYCVAKLRQVRRGRTVELMGCTPEFLREHPEKQFKPGWTWADWGPVFEIDHIIPCSAFDMSDPEQQKRCFHYSNLQPLEKTENRRKWNKILTAA